MKLLIRIITIIFAVILLFSMQAMAKVTTITIWAPHDFDVRYGPEYNKILWGPFEKENPDIKIRWVRVPEWEQKFRIAAAAGTLPDIFAVDGINVPAYAARGLLESLDRFIPAEVINDYVKGCYDEMVWEGKCYAVGLETNTQFVIYNPDLLAKAGLPGPPRYWEELVDFGKKLTIDTDGDGKIDQWAYIVYVGRGEYQMWLQTPYIWQNGGEVVDEKFNKALCNQPKAVEALQFVSDLFNKYKIAPKPGDILAGPVWPVVATGKFAIEHIGTFAILPVQKSYPEFKFKVAPHPWPRAGKRITGCGGWHFSLWTGSKSKEEAAKVMNYLTSPYIIQVLGDSYGIPMRKSLMGQFERMKYHPWDVVLDQLNYTKPRPRHPQYPYITDAIQEAFDRTVYGGVPAQEAMNEAARKIDLALAKK